MGADTVTNPEG